MDRFGNRLGYNVTVMLPEAFYLVNWHKIHKIFKKFECMKENR